MKEKITDLSSHKNQFIKTKEISLGEKRDFLKKNLYEKINKKINILEDVKEFVENKSTLNPEEFEKECQQKMDLIKENFDPSTREKYKKIIILEKELKRVNLKEDLLWQEIEKMFLDGKEEMEDDSDFLNYLSENEEFQNLQELSQRILEEIELLKSDDTDFLKKIDIFLDNIAGKRKQVFMLEREYKENPEIFWNKISYLINFDLRKVNKDKINVFFSGYGVDIILPEKEFNQATKGKERKGYHISKTIYNIIKDGPGKEDTINHENTHNLLESLGFFSFDSEKLTNDINERIKRFNRLKFLDAPQSIIEKEIFFLKKYIGNYIYLNFEELIADINNLPRKNIRSFTGYFLRAIDKVYKFNKEIKDPEINEIIIASLKEMENRFIDYVKKLADIFYIGEKFGNIEKVKAAIILFGPRKIKRIEKYLKNQVGAENYELLSILKPFTQEEFYFEEIAKIHKKNPAYKLFEGMDILKPSQRVINAFLPEKFLISFFNLDNLKRLNNLLEKQKENGRQEDVEKILKLIQKKQVKDLVWENLPNFFELNKDLLDINNILELDNQLKKLGNKLSILEFNNFVEKRLGVDFFIEHYKMAMKKDNFEELKFIYKNWPFSKKIFLELLTDLITNGWVFDDYLDYQEVEHTAETIKKSKFWDFLKEINFDKKAELLLRKLDI